MPIRYWTDVEKGIGGALPKSRRMRRKIQRPQGTLMRVLAFCVCLLTPSIVVSGQERAGAITGKVTDQTGATVTGVSVEAKNSTTGTVYRSSVVSSQGDYTIAELPAGTYEVSVPIPRGAFAEVLYLPFVQKDVAVQGGRTEQLNIALRLQMNLATLGDAPP